MLSTAHTLTSGWYVYAALAVLPLRTGTQHAWSTSKLTAGRVAGLALRAEFGCGRLNTTYRNQGQPRPHCSHIFTPEQLALPSHHDARFAFAVNTFASTARLPPPMPHSDAMASLPHGPLVPLLPPCLTCAPVAASAAPVGTRGRHRCRSRRGSTGSTCACTSAASRCTSGSRSAAEEGNRGEGRGAQEVR